MAIQFLDDHHSFIAPTYRFRNRPYAEAYSHIAYNERSPTTYAQATVQGWTYQPRNFQSLSTGLLNGELRTYGNTYIPFVTRSPDQPAPDDFVDDEFYKAENVCLLVGGRRSFFRYHQPTSARSRAYYDLVNDRYDCYSVWGREATYPLTPLYEATASRLYVARTAHGVIYSHLPTFSDGLKVTGFETRIVLVQFTIADHDPDKHDLMQLRRIEAQSQFTSDIREKPQPFPLDPRTHSELWCDLTRSAHEGFVQHCRSIPEDIERLRDELLARRGAPNSVRQQTAHQSANSISL